MSLICEYFLLLFYHVSSQELRYFINNYYPIIIHTISIYDKCNSVSFYCDVWDSYWWNEWPCIGVTRFSQDFFEDLCPILIYIVTT